MISITTFFEVILIILAVGYVLADPSCKAACSHDGYPLPCGVWLKNETKSGSLGTYALHSGVAKLQCSFSSLPEPVHVQWMFRPSESVNSQWREFPCSKKEERKKCQEQEIVVESSCEIRTNSLEMSGTYKCAASLSSHQDQRYRAYSSEFPITVVGNEPAKVIASRLLTGKSGQINLEVCANPRPEIFWHTVDGILTSESTTSRFAVTSLASRKILGVRTEPIKTIPYCYTTTLLIHELQNNDRFHISIRGELDMIHEHISVVIKVNCKML